MNQDHISQTEPTAAPVRIRVLGRFAIEVDGSPQRFPGRGPHKPLELLKVLVALGGDSVAAEVLADALWPEADGDHATLRKAGFPD